MRKNITVFFIILLLFPASAMGEILTVKHSVKQTLVGDQATDDARISATARAKREALEKASTYIESLTVFQNSKMEQNEILAITAGVLQAEVISQNNYSTDDGPGIEIIVNVFVDTSVLQERVKKLLQDKTHLAQLKDNSKREKELLLKVAILEEETRHLMANKQSTQKLKKDFQQASQGLMALDWFNKALSLWDGERYTDPKKAIEYLSNAISLQPDMASTYNARGNAYYDLGKHQLAIEDFTEAIRLKPDYVDAHYIRGNTYYKLGHYPRAIEDLKIAAGLGHEVAQVILKSSGIGSISADVPIVKKPDKPLELAVEQVQSPQVKSENYEDINSNAAKQSVLIAWQKAQREFFSENPDYSKDKALNNTYVSILDELISKPEAAKMTDRQILLEAKRIVENSLGTLPKPPKVDAGESYSVITGLKGIELRNGDVIEGQVISVDSDFVMIRTKDGKVLSYSFMKEFRWFITE